MKSVGEVLDRQNGIGKGFDLLRLTLSISVIAIHTYQVAFDRYENFAPGLWWVFQYSILVMFFGLSGFLISGSALRLALRDFLINRGMRIFPALTVEVLLSAFILGPIFTTFSLQDYFTNYRFFLYLGNILGVVYYKLPGTFNGDWVNGSLWTVPFEMGCYAIISILIFKGAMKRRWVPLALTILLLAIQIGLELADYKGQPIIARSVADVVRFAPQNLVDYVFYSRGAKLLVAFTAGIAAYLYRYEIPFSKFLFASCLGFALGAQYVANWQGDVTPLANTLLVFPLIYITAFLGVSDIPTPPIFRHGDYSYGIYLYGFPFMRVIETLFTNESNSWAFLFFASLLPTVIFAVFSWHCIEKPILKLRRKFSFVARQRLEHA